MEQTTEEKLEKLEQELKLVQRQLELVQLIDETKAKLHLSREPSHTNTHPVGTLARFTNPNEKPSLRGKDGEVTGHSPKFVRVRKNGREYRRLPGNLTPLKKR